MSPLLRRFLIGLALLAALAGGVAAWLVASFDGERAKALAIDWMKTHRNRTLVIAGPLELSVFPRLEVGLSQARLSEPGGAAEFATVERVSLAVALWPLLSKTVVIDGVSAHGLHLAYTRDAQGASNIDDLIGPRTPQAPDAGASTAGDATALRFDVSRIEATDLRARVDDALTGVRGDVAIESLHSGRLADQAESPLSLKAQFALASPPVRGSLSGETRIALDLAAHAVKLREMALAFKGDAAGASAIDATLKGALAWNSAQGTLLADDLALEGAATLGGLKLGGTRLALKRFAFDPKQQALALTGLALQLQGDASGSPLKLTLDWPQLDVKGQGLQGSALSGTLALEGGNRVAGSFKSAPPQGDFAQVLLPGFEANWSGSTGPRKVGGRLTGELTLRPAERSLALAKLDLALQWPDALSRPLALALRGDAGFSARQAHWALAGQLAGSNLSTQGDAVFSGAVPAVQMQARFDALDLDALLPPAPTAAGASAPDPARADAAIDLSPLRRLNGRFDLRAGSLKLRASQVRDAVLEAALDGGRLAVSTLRGKAFGGTVDASGAADANGNRVALKALASGVDVNALERAFTGRDILEGRGQVALDVQTAGKDTGAMKSQLQGTASMQLRDGAVKGINLAKSMRQAKAALALKKDASIASAQVEKTDFSELSVSFRIDNGVARSNDLVLKSPFLRLGGEGAVDIGQSSIDYTVRATAVVTPTGQDGADLMALKGLTVPVHLSGPLAAIQWKIQWSTIVLATAQDQVKALLQGGLRPAAPGASSASSPAGTNPRKELADRLLKGLFK